MDTKIKGKDHKKLEYLLELEPFPVNISGEAANSSDEISISQTCTTLNVELNEINIELLGLGLLVVDASDDEGAWKPYLYCP